MTCVPRAYNDKITGQVTIRIIPEGIRPVSFQVLMCDAGKREIASGDVNGALQPMDRLQRPNQLRSHIPAVRGAGMHMNQSKPSLFLRDKTSELPPSLQYKTSKLLSTLRKTPQNPLRPFEIKPPNLRRLFGIKFPNFSRLFLKKPQNLLRLFERNLRISAGSLG